MSLFLIPPIQGPGDGIFPADMDVRVTLRGATNATFGEVLQFDLAQSDADVTTKFGSKGAFANVITPVAAGIKFGVMCVAQEAITADAKGKVKLIGLTQAELASNIVVGQALVPTIHRRLDPTLNSNEQVCAIAMITGGGATSNSQVWFNGMGGGFASISAP